MKSNDKVLCACGCGQYRLKYDINGVEKKFINFHYYNIPENRKSVSEKLKNQVFTEEHKRNIGLGNKGKPKSEEHKQKLRDNAKINPNYGMKGKHHTEETIKEMREKRALQIISEETIQKLRKISEAKKGKSYEELYGIEKATELKIKHSKLMKGENNPFYGKNHTEVTKENLSKSKKGKKIHSEEYKKKITLRNILNWKNPEYRKKMLSKEMLSKRNIMKKPTSYERKIIDLCLKYSLPFIYRGNSSFLINLKHPDFVNEGKRIVIEVFHSYFKIKRYGSVDNYKEYCRNKYEPVNWKVIFLDENDVLADNWEERCLNKINEMLIKNEVEINVKR